MTSADWHCLSIDGSGRRVLELLESAELLRAQALAGLAVFDAANGAQIAGFTDTAAWLVAERRMPRREATGMLARARVSRDHPVVADAHAAGRIHEDHIAVLATAAGSLPAPVLEVSMPILLELSGATPASDVRAALGRIVDEVTADRAEVLDATDVDLFTQRRLQVSRTIAGLVHVNGVLDPETGALFQAVLAPLAAPRDRPARLHGEGGEGGVCAPYTDKGSAAALAGPCRDLRTGDQRRVDALAEMCQRLLAGGELPMTGGQKPHLTLVVDLPTLAAHTGGGLGTRSQLTGFFDTTLGPEAARRLSCDASAAVVVTDQVGVPLALGRTTRTVTASQLKVLRVRDNGCVFPGCNRPMEFSQAHHVVHWAQGGPTDTDNLVMLCSTHHRLIHHSEWQLAAAGDKPGEFEWWPPGGRPPLPAQHQPRRNPLNTFTWACVIARIHAALALCADFHSSSLRHCHAESDAV